MHVSAETNVMGMSDDLGMHRGSDAQGSVWVLSPHMAAKLHVGVVKHVMSASSKRPGAWQSSCQRMLQQGRTQVVQTRQHTSMKLPRVVCMRAAARVGHLAWIAACIEEAACIPVTCPQCKPMNPTFRL